jgi:hypothetical protein
MQQPASSVQEWKNGDGTQSENSVDVYNKENDQAGQKPENDVATDTTASLRDDELLRLGEASTTQPVAAAGVFNYTPKDIDLSAVKPMLDLMRRESDGKIVVSLFTPNPSGSLVLQRDPEIRYQRRVYSVPSMPPALYHSLVLPTDVQTYRSVHDLFYSVLDLLKKHVPLTTPECALVTYWSMATWFPDCLQLCPALLVTGTASAADLLLRTLLAVCRRPLLLADVSPAVLRALPLGELMPTLLIRSSQTTGRMAALLDSSSRPGYLIPNGKGFQQFYCPKCIYLGEDVNDDVKTSTSIRVHIGGKIGRSFQSPPTGDLIKDFQNRLLTYRLLNREQVTNSNFRVSGFRPEYSAIAEILGATIVGDHQLQTTITSLLEARDEQSRVDQANGPIGVVLRALLSHCHQEIESQVFVREIAATANRMSNEEGDLVKLSNENVGHLLKNLRLYTRRLGSNGGGLVLDRPMQIRVHWLSQAYEVLPAQPACGFCNALQATQTEVVTQDV